MIAIIDYGVGNLFSIARSLAFLGAESIVTGDAADIERADRVILPGVGAFGDAMDKLNRSGLVPVVKRLAGSGRPLMGICLGMQLLFDEGLEYGVHAGLSLLPGRIVPLKGAIPPALKVPQMGWNALAIKRPHPLTQSVGDGDCVYYVHSFYADAPKDIVVATSEYGIDVPGIVARDNVVGCQFHPEKSGDVGLGILKAFTKL